MSLSVVAVMVACVGWAVVIKWIVRRVRNV